LTFNYYLAVEKILIYSAAMLASVLPARYRRRLHLENSLEMRDAALISGLIQCFLCSALYAISFKSQIVDSMSRIGTLILDNQTSPINPMQFRLTTGVLGIADFMLQPLHLFMGCMALEGMVRGIAAFATHEALPTLPLYAISALHDRIDQARRKRELGPPIADEIQPAHDDSYDIRVLSCHPKVEWNPYISIRFREDFYVLAGEEVGQKPRPFVYRLRKNPTGRLVVVIREYRLDDPVTKPPYRGL